MCPFTRIHPRTDAALRELAPDAERVDLNGGTAKYSELLLKLWHAGESVLIVEHDVQLTERALRQALRCKCEWSTSQYRGANRGLITHALGCTRFRSSLMQAIPDAMELALADISFGRDTTNWLNIDAKLAGVLRKTERQPHVHEEVPHHHVYDYGCACGEPGPHG